MIWVFAAGVIVGLILGMTVTGWLDREPSAFDRVCELDDMERETLNDIGALPETGW